MLYDKVTFLEDQNRKVNDKWTTNKEKEWMSKKKVYEEIRKEKNGINSDSFHQSLNEVGNRRHGSRYKKKTIYEVGNKENVNQNTI